jgi:hypothetical protein
VTLKYKCENPLLRDGMNRIIPACWMPLEWEHFIQIKQNELFNYSKPASEQSET